MRTLSWVILVVTAIGCLIACDSHSTVAPIKPTPTPPPANSPEWTGVLRGGMAGIGGESTGWVLDVDAEPQSPEAGRQIDVDVEKVREAARAFDGYRVRITGTVIRKEYVERGEQPVLVATGIRRAE